MKRKTISRAKKKAWVWFSRYIRLMHADSNGSAVCVTCGEVKHWKQMQAGHFIPAGKGNATRYLEDNVHVQCYRCNINLGSNGAEYYPFMVKTYGQERVDELRALSNTTLKISIAEFEAMEQKYKSLCLDMGYE